MICKCPSCDGALEYNPAHEKMECLFCGNVFEPQAAMQAASRVQILAEEPTIVHTNKNNTQETMEFKIYACTSCGGELMVNDVEVSTFCSYCGQPTVVFSRVSRELKPGLILPFRIRKEQALEIIRNKFKKGGMVPKEIKNFEVERLRGIYIPYFLYNIYCYDLQIIEGKDKEDRIHRFLREAQCEYKGIPVEASYHLDDSASSLLGGFDFRELKKFEPAYLSGFYADRYDIREESVREAVIKRLQSNFNRKIGFTVSVSDKRILEQHPKVEIRNHDYALLPVWFMTFRYKNEPYTMLVNGQSGELVGAVPFEKKRLVGMFLVIFIIATIVFCILGALFCMLMLHSEPGDLIESIFGTASSVIIMNIITFGTGAFVWANYKRKVKSTKEKRMERFVKERQEDT